MENVAHTVVGLLLAEGAMQWHASRSSDPAPPAFGRIAYWLSAVCNNLPDVDLLYVGITPGKLGYLLHHRGHTHTVLGGLLLSILPFLIALAVARRRGLSRQLQMWLGGLAFMGPL